MINSTFSSSVVITSCACVDLKVVKKFGTKGISSEWTKLRLSLEFIRKSKENVRERRKESITELKTISVLGQFYEPEDDLDNS